MPGYDRSRFENLQSIHHRLTCSICHGIFSNPVVVPCCGHTYCSDCINVTRNLICPNDKSKINKSELSKAPLNVVDMINHLRLYCNYKQSGCEEVVELEKLPLHLDDCDYSPFRICKNCGFEMGQKEEHDCVRNLKEENERIRSENERIKCEQKNKTFMGIGVLIGITGTLLVIYCLKKLMNK